MKHLTEQQMGFIFLVISHHALNYVFPRWLEQEVEDRYAHLEFEGDLDLAIV